MIPVLVLTSKYGSGYGPEKHEFNNDKIEHDLNKTRILTSPTKYLNCRNFPTAKLFPKIFLRRQIQ